MMRIGTTVLFVAASLLAIINAEAMMTDGQGAPYRAIAQRNVFRLSAPAISLAPQPTQPIAPPKITLTGIASILGRRLAFLTVAAMKPGQAAESFTLGEGQVVKDVEIKTIDEKAGIVSVINHGERQVLDFDHNGAETSDSRHDPASQFIINSR